MSLLPEQLRASRIALDPCQADADPPARFEIRLRHRNIPREDLVEDLRRVAREKGGHRMTIALYTEKGRFAVNTATRRFGSWNAALEAAGLP